jgi:hypothetical protein
MMQERPAPAEILTEAEAHLVVDGRGKVERWAIALVLRDLEGWATLYGREQRLDPMTGQPLDPAVRYVGIFDRRERPGLPSDWIDLLIRLRWLDLADTATGFGHRPLAGRSVSSPWLPDHLQTQ